MIRRKKLTIFTDAKDTTTVFELKKMIEGKCVNRDMTENLFLVGLQSRAPITVFVVMHGVFIQYIILYVLLLYLLNTKKQCFPLFFNDNSAYTLNVKCVLYDFNRP